MSYWSSQFYDHQWQRHFSWPFKICITVEASKWHAVCFHSNIPTQSINILLLHHIHMLIKGILSSNSSVQRHWSTMRLRFESWQCASSYPCTSSTKVMSSPTFHPTMLPHGKTSSIKPSSMALPKSMESWWTLRQEFIFLISHFFTFSSL